MIHIIAAIDLNRAIGLRGDMLYHFRDDLRRFKSLTMGHPLIMGRKTFDSLPGGALPGRKNIVITRNSDWQAPGAIRAENIARAIEIAGDDPDIFIIGGGQIYSDTLAIADRLDLTIISSRAPEADTYFPDYEDDFVEIDREDHPQFSFVTFVRRNPGQ